MEKTGINDLARQLFDSLPAAAHSVRTEIEGNFRALLQARLGKLELATRSEFDLQSKLLQRTEERVAQLESLVADLEKRLQALKER